VKFYIGYEPTPDILAGFMVDNLLTSSTHAISTIFRARA